MDAVKKGKFDYNGPEWKGVSDNAKDLINKMLCKPDKRLKAGEILQHAWMTEKLENIKGTELNFTTLKSFRNSEKLKKASLTFIAS